MTEDTGASASADQALVASDQAASRLAPMGFDPSRLRLERYDRDCTRILDGGGAVVALIEALSNGRWIISDLQDRQIVGRSFGTVKLAFAWFRSGAFDAAIAMEAHRGATGNTDATAEGGDSAGLAEASPNTDSQGTNP